jgi:hypothetical protein
MEERDDLQKQKDKFGKKKPPGSKAPLRDSQKYIAAAERKQTPQKAPEGRISSVSSLC